jgi:hypothetical protein
VAKPVYQIGPWVGIIGPRLNEFGVWVPNAMDLVRRWYGIRDQDHPLTEQVRYFEALLSGTRGTLEIKFGGDGVVSEIVLKLAGSALPEWLCYFTWHGCGGHIVIEIDDRLRRIPDALEALDAYLSSECLCINIVTMDGDRFADGIHVWPLNGNLNHYNALTLTRHDRMPVSVRTA